LTIRWCHTSLVDLYAEYRRHQADGVGRHGNGVDEEELLGEAGLADVAAATLEVAIPVADGDMYWRWSRSHGSGRFIDGLPEDRRTEMRAPLRRVRRRPAQLRPAPVRDPVDGAQAGLTAIRHALPDGRRRPRRTAQEVG
jgi:hypothetical protein